jgi:fructokinase
MSYKVIGIGEALWDLLPSGPQLGGAPANFAYHAHALGAHACVVTRVGNDSFGRTIIERFEQMGIADGTVQIDDTAATGTVTVSLSGNGIPNFTIHEQVAWDRIAVTSKALDAVRQADAICFGTLAQRSESARISIQRLVAAASGDKLRVFDINLRQNYFSRQVIEESLRLANILKLNDAELPILASFFSLKGNIQDQIKQLAKKFSLQVVALTRGPAGSLLYQAGQWSDCPSVPISIKDTVGAGDAFTAALVMGLLQKMKLDEINTLADEVARYVCSCHGATPPLPRVICDRFAAKQKTQKIVSGLVSASQN